MKKHSVCKVTSIVAGLALWCGPDAQAILATYQEGVAGYTHDASIAFNTDPNTAGDAGWNLNVGAIGSGVIRRSYLGFDLTGIPMGAFITNVTLALTIVDSGGPFNTGTRAIELHEITAAGPINESLTWNGYDGVNNWVTPGGDFAAAVLSSRSDNISSGVQTWLSTPAFVAAAQSALSGDGRLEMILLSPTAEAETFSYRGWAQNEDGTVANRPLLSVEYTLVPEPTSAALLGLGALLLLRRKAAAVSRSTGATDC
jgi:hypothetical protein